jgi:hypothetical protein
MKRLPGRTRDADDHKARNMFSITVTDAQAELLDDEVIRTGLKTKTALIRSILDLYFDLEVD